MKKSIILAMAATALVLGGCNKLLDKEPRDKFINNPSFWSNQNQVENYCNSFYANFPSYGTSGTYGEFYFLSLGDDQVNPNFDNWSYTAVPGSATDWNTPFSEIRRANYLITGMTTSSLSEDQRNYYTAIGRLNRAYQYFKLVRAYGDVQWLEEVPLNPDPNDGLVQGARTDRDVVIDKVIEDIDFAIDHLGNSNKVVWGKDMALAMKSDICLYEGTYCKYRTAADNGKAADASRANNYLNLCVNACEQLMNAGYSLSANYGDIYNSLNLKTNSEIIFMRNYEKDVLGHSTVDYTTGSTAQRGLSKDAFDAFLFTDGKPLATTSLDKSDVATLDANGHYSIEGPLAVRDKRLGVLIDHVLAFKGHGYARDAALAEMTSPTGYTIAKYDNDQMGNTNDTKNYYRNQIGNGYTDGPIYWLAVIYLNYAEAKAELGSCTDADLNRSVNLLQARAGLPALTTSPAVDPANDWGISSLLWEIRRARRCELMTDKGYRYWDLVRWHKLDKLDTNKYPNIALGANMSAVTDCEVDLKDGYAIGNAATRTYDKKYYFYPVPSNQLSLNKNCTQNPGW